MSRNAFLFVLLTTAFVRIAISDAVPTDPLTKLPIAPIARAQLSLSTTPVKLDDMLICKGKIVSNFYSANGQEKVAATVAWYSANLNGFKHTGGYVNGHSRDTFYNAAGTAMVTITGQRAKQGVSANSEAIVYIVPTPALAEKTIIALNLEQTICT